MNPGGNMYDLSGWVQITCTESDDLRDRLLDRRVSSSLTDPAGYYGDPIIYTEWEHDGTAVMRDYQWPGGDRTCKHYVPGGESRHPRPAMTGG